MLNFILVLATSSFLISTYSYAQEEPALPLGLTSNVAKQSKNISENEPVLPLGLDSNEPDLPIGLDSSDNEPALPDGIESESESESEVDSDDDSQDNETSWRDELPFDLTGFIESRYGMRLKSNSKEKQTSIGEARLHLEIVKSWDKATGTLTTDFVYDPVLERYGINLQNGEGWLDLREANLLFRPSSFSDLKIGRQILTWGTGDLIFINDLFPKDWNSFFIGRDEKYLKGPSDAIKLAIYNDIANLDVIFTPKFNPDRFIDGRRISHYSNNTLSIVGRKQPIRTDNHNQWFVDNEVALRLHRIIDTYEVAAYFYHGYWKSPAGQNATTGLYTFPRLSVYGASIRGPLGDGIINGEMGYYDSLDDRNGKNALINNSELRFLLGYEQELWSEMTANLQYYSEWLQNYDSYSANQPNIAPKRDELRHLITLRLTQLLMNQTLKLSLFTYYSPSDKDAYLRPNINYKLDDYWTASLGGNLFYGKKTHTFFGQLEDNSNIYASIRFGF